VLERVAEGICVLWGMIMLRGVARGIEFSSWPREAMVEGGVCVEGDICGGVRCKGSKRAPTMDESGPLNVGDGVA